MQSEYRLRTVAGDAEPVARQKSHNGAGHPGPEAECPTYRHQRIGRMARPKGEPAPNIIPATDSIPIQYTMPTSTMDLALGDGSVLTRRSSRRTLQLSGRALCCPARRRRIMKWRDCGAHLMTYHGPLQLLVRQRHCLRLSAVPEPTRSEARR
jgi:hypothetical protein